MLLALLHPVVLGVALRVQGEVTCPAPARVASDLLNILEISAEHAEDLHADLVREGAWLDLTLTGPDGTSLGERRFDANEDCAVLSHTVAVVLATWLSDEHPEYVVALPTRELAPKSAAPSNGAAPVATEATRPALPKPAKPPVSPALVPGRATAAPTARAEDGPTADGLAASAALGGALGSSEFAPAAWLGVSLDPSTKGVGADLTAAWVANRSEPLATHEVRWTRWPLLLGPYLRLLTRSGRFDLGAGAALAWLHLQGRDFSPNVGSSHAAFGSYAALRFLPRAGAWQPFVMVAPVLWFGRTTAIATGADGAAADVTLPSLDLMFAAGLRFLP